MRLLLALGSLIASPLAAQTHPLPAPRPSRVLWLAPAPQPQDTVRATTGAGKATWIGAGVGAIAGYSVSMLCGLDDSVGHSCLVPNLLGIALGGLAGAMIGSALEGDHHPTGASAAQ